MNQIPPRWYHPPVRNVSFIAINERSDKTRNELKLGSLGSVLITIFLHPERIERADYLLIYEIRQPSGKFVVGKIEISKIDLKKAFGLSGECDVEDEQQIPGKYIKHGSYLNIPGPGTGNDGDPNVSIYLDEALVSNVRAFLD